MLRRGSTKSREIRLDEGGVIRSFGTVPAIEVECDFDVPTHQSLFEFAAKLHLERFGTAGHP